MGNHSDRIARLADAIYDWLLEQSANQTVPRLVQLAPIIAARLTPIVRTAFGVVDSYVMQKAMDKLLNQRRIAIRRGSPGAFHGHYALRILATGETHTTENCPFPPPPPQPDKITAQEGDHAR